MVFFLIPNQMVLKTPSSDIIFLAGRWASVFNFLEASWYLLTPLNMLVFSVIGPAVFPIWYTETSLIIFKELPIYWMLLAAVFVAFTARCLWGLKGSPAKAVGIVPGLALFLLAYIAAFIYFSPSQQYIFTVVSLLPWLLIIHSGYVGIRSRIWRVVAVMLVVGVIVNNFVLVSYVNELMESNPYNWIQENVPFPFAHPEP